MTNARTARNTREKAAQLRAEAARREARRRSVLVTAIVATVLALLVGGFVVVRQAQQSGTGGGAVPATAADGSAFVGSASAPVTLTVHEDFQCPACKAFEDENAAQLQAMVDAGTVRIEYKPIAFLDRASTDDYSTRALNAAAVVLDKAPQGFARFHAELFAQQPAEGGPGLPDARLIELATQAGVPQAEATRAVEDVSYRGWTRTVTEQASKDGVNSTPTVAVNGTPLTERSASAVKAAIDAAAAAR